MGLYALTKNWQLSLKDYYFRAIHPRPSMRGILAVFRKTFYTKKVEKEPVIIIKGGKPVAALVSIINADIETVSLSNNPKFIALTRIMHFKN